MTNTTHAFATQAAASQQANNYFATKLACETDCADVYADIKANNQDYLLLDVRSHEAFEQSHAISAINMPHNDINAESMAHYPKHSQFVVYCWGPGCNGASKAALKISALGFAVKEMIGGIHYWEDFERYPVNRRRSDVQC
jgi:rhodanese-related sulfurtransferase